MKSSLSFSRSAAILSLLLVTLASAHTASAQSTIPLRMGTYKFSTIGVARGQMARLNVFYENIFPPGPCAPGENCFPPGPCTPGRNCFPPGPCAPGENCPTGSFTVSLSFADCEGNIVARNDINLTPYRGGSISFTPSSFMADGRACARASVTVQPDANGFLPDLAPTVDILDIATGQSTLINAGSIRGDWSGPGDLSLGLFNVVKGQTARVSVAFVDMPDGFPPGPCRATLTFYGGDGQQISESTIPLNIGQTAQFDFPTTNFPNGARARIRASVKVESSEGELIGLLMPAVEVFASDTGKGTLFYPGAAMGSMGSIR